MPTLRVTYRMPSLVVLQPDPLPDLTFLDGKQQLTIREPQWDPRLSSALPWVNLGPRRYPYRLADVLVLEAVVPRAAVVQERADLTVTDDAPAFDAIDAILRRNAARLLLLLQVETGQAWIGFLPKFSAWHDTPMEYQLVDDDGAAMLLPTIISEPDIGERWWLTEETWQRIGKRLADGDDPALPRILLAEALAFEIAGRTRSAILSLAMACEIALKSFIAELADQKALLHQYLVENEKHLNILNYLDDVLKLATGKSARKDFVATDDGIRLDYRKLRRLFEARNKVVHSGRAAVPANGGKRKFRNVNAAMLQDFRAVAKAFVTWIDGLRTAAEAETVQPLSAPR